MKAYHFRQFVGPTTVEEVAARLGAQSMPWQHVTVRGTEHVHFSIDATNSDAARREVLQWFDRAGLGTFHTAQLLRVEEV